MNILSLLVYAPVVLSLLVALYLLLPVCRQRGSQRFAYRRCRLPWGMLVVLTLTTGGLLWQQKDIGDWDWQTFRLQHHNEIVNGLHDKSAMQVAFEQYGSRYCFALQRYWLANVDYLEHTNNVEPLSNLARCHLLGGHVALAQQAVTLGWQAQPTAPELHYLAAELLFLQEQRLSPQALEHLMITLQAQPEHLDALWLLMVNSLNQGNVAQAQFFMAQLRLQHPNNMELFEALARVKQRIEAQLASDNNDSSNIGNDDSARQEMP